MKITLRALVPSFLIVALWVPGVSLADTDRGEEPGASPGEMQRLEFAKAHPKTFLAAVKQVADHPRTARRLVKLAEGPDHGE